MTIVFVDIAYFSMEVGLEAGIPTYSGGLGTWQEIPFVQRPTSKYPWSRLPFCIAGSTFINGSLRPESKARNP